MKYNEFNYDIDPNFEPERLTGLIYYRGELLAEIFPEEGQLMIQIHPIETADWWTIPMEQFQKVLNDLKSDLLNSLA